MIKLSDILGKHSSVGKLHQVPYIREGQKVKDGLMSPRKIPYI